MVLLVMHLLDKTEDRDDRTMTSPTPTPAPIHRLLVLVPARGVASHLRLDLPQTRVLHALVCAARQSASTPPKTRRVHKNLQFES